MYKNEIGAKCARLPAAPGGWNWFPSRASVTSGILPFAAKTVTRAGDISSVYIHRDGGIYIDGGRWISLGPDIQEAISTYRAMSQDDGTPLLCLQRDSHGRDRSGQ